MCAGEKEEGRVSLKQGLSLHAQSFSQPHVASAPGARDKACGHGHVGCQGPHQGVVSTASQRATVCPRPAPRGVQASILSSGRSQPGQRACGDPSGQQGALLTSLRAQRGFAQASLASRPSFVSPFVEQGGEGEGSDWPREAPSLRRNCAQDGHSIWSRVRDLVGLLIRHLSND